MAKWYDQYLTNGEKNNLQVGQKGIRARNRKRQIENQTSLGNPKGLRDLEKSNKKSDTHKKLERALQNSEPRQMMRNSEPRQMMRNSEPRQMIRQQEREQWNKAFQLNKRKR